MDGLHAERSQRLMEGYLEKSPPPNTSSLRVLLSCARAQSGILRKRWHKRYFVLSKVRKHQRTEIFFEYYKDRECQKFKGRVDLENCKCIINNVEVAGKGNVFSLETEHIGRHRIYYFAATSDEIMINWVASLVRVTGFEDIDPSPPPAAQLAGAPNPLRIPGWPDRVTSPHLSPISSALLNHPPPMSSRPCLGLSSDGSLARSRPNRQLSEVTGCDETLMPEMDYQLTAPEHDPDGYYKLVDVLHSYVNLSTSVEDPKQEQAVVNDAKKSSDHEQCPALPARMKLNDKQSPKALMDNECTRDDNVSSHSDSQYDLCMLETPAPPSELRKSTDSVYLTVWDSSGQELDFTVPSESRIDDTEPHSPPPIVPRHPAGVPNLNPVAGPCAVRPRDAVISDYQELPSIDAPLTPAPPPPSQSVSRNSGVPPPIPVKPPSLMHAANPIIMAQRSLPVGNSSQLAQVEPRAPLRNLQRASSFEACSDLVLPVRTVTSNASEDTSSASDLDDDSDPSATQANKSTVPARPGGCQQASDQHSLLLPTSVPPVAPVPRPAFPGPAENTPGTSVFTPILPSQPLNYIEPCNLELGLLNGSGSGTRLSHHNNGSTVVTTSINKLIGGVGGSADLNRQMWTTGEESTHHLKSGDQSIASNHPQGRTQTMLSLSPLSNSDERIEYKEIDPLGTRALEAVSKHF